MKRLPAAALLLSGVLCAAEKWTHVATANFEIYTTAGPSTATYAIKRFEMVREFFAQSLGLAPQTTEPVRLIAFGSEKEFAPYRPSEASSAYYLPARDRDFIVSAGLGDGLWRMATHEYVHLLMKYSGVRAPVWLNEGTAELFAGMTQVGDHMRVGAAPAGHLLTLRNSKPVPLEEFFQVDLESDRYTTRRHAGVFYSQSWAVAHMLYLDDRYMKGRPRFITAILDGASPAVAFQSVYGKTMQQVFVDIEGYVRQDAYLVANFPFRAPKKIASGEPRAVEPAEARLVTAELLASMPGKEGAAGAAIESLLAEAAPQSPAQALAHELAAFFHWRHNRREKALDHFAKAIAAGSKSARTHADYAVVLGSRNLELSEELLTKAIALRPDWVEARVRLAGVYNQRRKYGASLSTILQVKRIRPTEAFDLFQTSALAYAGLSQFKDARTALAKASEYAGTDARRQYLKSLAGFVDRAEQRATLAREIGVTPEQLAVAVKETEADGERPPVLRRDVQPGGETANVAPELDEPAFRQRLLKHFGEGLHGELIEMDCSAAKPVFVVASEKRVWRFLLDDPGQVIVTGAPGASIELVCGAQKKQPVTVRFGPSATAGLDGELKGLTFE